MKLRTRYDRAGERLREARDKYDEARAFMQSVKARLDEAEAEFKTAQDALDDALARATAPAQTPAPVAVPTPVVVPVSKAAPVTVPPNLQELIDTFPPAGGIKKVDLKDTLGIKDSAVSTRLQKAKKLGLVDKAAWGVWELTDAGRKARGRRLQAVP